MKQLNFDIDAPSGAREVLHTPEGAVLFLRIAKSALLTEAKASKATYEPLLPNSLKVTPYLMDWAVRHILDSSVELAEAGRLQVRQHVIETAWTDVGGKEVLGLRDVDSGNIIEPPLSEDALQALLYFNAGFAAETMRNSQ